MSLSSSRPRSFLAALSLSEDSAESGGDNTAPVGMRRLFTGGGDWRMLFTCAKSAVEIFVSSAAAVDVGCTSSTFVIEGDRLCL